MRIQLTLSVIAAAIFATSGVQSAHAATLTYNESGGVVIGDAEAFSSRTAAGNGTTWTIKQIENSGTSIANGGPRITNARSNQYLQTLPDNLTPGGPNVAPIVGYQMLVNTPGEYQLYARWDGNDTNGTTRGQSDTFFAGVKELKDGLGGAIADWYELQKGVNGNFQSPAWDAGGGFEQNVAGPANNPMVWTINTPGIYTLEFSQREDGAAVDAFVFQRSNLAAPTQFGAPPSLLTAGAGNEQVANLTPDADSYVRFGQPTTNFGGSGQLAVKDSGASSTTRQGYVRFDLSDISESASLFDAQFQLDVTTNNNGGSPNDPTPNEYFVDIYGLNDGSTDGLGETWGESAINWNNAPGNNTGTNGVDLSEVTLLGRITVPQINPSVDGVYTISLNNFNTSGALLDFLNADSDGLVTFILVREDSPSNNLVFASREDTSATGPTLILVLAAIPEPSSVALLSLGLVSLGSIGWRRRR